MKRRTHISILAILLAVTLSISAASAPVSNTAPEAENLELTTFRGVSVGGQLNAVDPDNDIISYEITTGPVKGTVELQDSGEFVYTPAEGKKGKDYFGFKATDAAGNSSQEGTVIIKIGKKAAVTYSDMSGRSEYYDAVMLADNNIFIGEKLGASYFFDPDRAVTRGQFLSMCMELTDAKLLSGVMSTGFSDDDTIPMWEKQYISTAVMNGAVMGYAAVSGGVVFNSGMPITKAEAAQMLSKTAGIEDVICIDNEQTPWYAQSVANLTSCGVISDGEVMSDNLSRAQAAVMLVNALNALKNSK